MASLIFEENSNFGYKDRTRRNAAADVTIAFALDFSTAGEKLTKKCVEEQEKIYIPIDVTSLSFTTSLILSTVNLINGSKTKTISLNIAGNGIYTLIKRDYKYNQSEIDFYTYKFLSAILTNSKLEKFIVLIRSGGQTGFDEAGIKAGMRLNIPSLVHAPKDWVFRNESGIDIKDEIAFKQRFII